MKNIPQFVLDKSQMGDLVTSLRKASLDLQQLNNFSKTTPEGIEQVWLCSDKSGSLFVFSVFEESDRSPFELKRGEVCLVLGPREKGAPKRMRKEVLEAVERLERAIVALGGRRRVP